MVSSIVAFVKAAVEGPASAMVKRLIAKKMMKTLYRKDKK